MGFMHVLLQSPACLFTLLYHIVLRLETYESSWRRSGCCVTQSPACNLQVTSEGRDWGDSVWGCGDASSIIDHASLKIGVAQINPSTSGGHWISAKNTMRLKVFEVWDALEQKQVGTNEWLEYFPTSSTTSSSSFLNKQSMHKSQ
jgi:hypothetical protein